MRCRNFFSAAIRQGSGAWPPFLDNNSWICLFFTLVALSRHRLVFPFHPTSTPPHPVCLSSPTFFFVCFYVPVSHRDLCSGLWWPWHLCVGHLPLWRWLDGHWVWPEGVSPSLQRTWHLQGRQMWMQSGLERRTLHYWYDGRRFCFGWGLCVGMCVYVCVFGRPTKAWAVCLPACVCMKRWVWGEGSSWRREGKACLIEFVQLGKAWTGLLKDLRLAFMHFNVGMC